MNNSQQETLLEDLRASAEEACQAARIEHDTVLDSALEKGDRTIAILFSLDPDKPLPVFSRSGVVSSNPVIGRKNRTRLQEILKLQQKLFGALETRLDRIQTERGHLRSGRRCINSMRDNLRIKAGKQLDRIG